MSQFIRIVGWEKYQHYKDRNPPWIKLHRELLTSNTWVTLDDAGRVLAVAIMMLAAATENKIPAKPGYLRRVAYLNCEPDLAPLVDVGFIEIVEEVPEHASAPLAPASNLQADARPETEKRRDRVEKKDSAPAALVRFEDEFPKFWETYPKREDRGHALKAFIAARKRGIPLETILAGAERYRDKPDRDPKFTKNAQGWLTGECWNDSPAVAPPTVQTITPEEREANRLATYAEIIKHGRPPGLAFTGADRHKLIQRGLVTMEQCERAGCAA